MRISSIYTLAFKDGGEGDLYISTCTLSCVLLLCIIYVEIATAISELASS